MAVLHTPRMVALIPGQSPPEVKIPIFMFCCINRLCGKGKKKLYICHDAGKIMFLSADLVRKNLPLQVSHIRI